MSKIEVEFAFEIGDKVYTRTASHHAGRRPKAFIVYERLAQECHGGIQRLYKCYELEGYVPEIVLTREMPPYGRMSPEAIKEELELENVRAEHIRNWYRKETREQKKD